jgi:phage terminase large subunit GpA-like protein
VTMNAAAILTKDEREKLKQLSVVNPTLYFALNGHRTHRGKRLDFSQNPFQVQIYHDTHPWTVIPKSTQCGISEWLMTTAIGNAYAGRNVFYVLPTGLLVGRFVKERFDKTIQLTPIYQQLGAADKEQGRRNAMSVTMKQLGPGTIAYVGSNSPASFTEFAADIGIIDELDK